MADSSKTDLSTLAKRLQEQVDIITAYLAAEKLPEPSFVPSGDPAKSAISSLPPTIEEARKKAYSLSWGLHTLLGTPNNHLVLNVIQVFSASTPGVNSIKVLQRRGSQGCDGEKHRLNHSGVLARHAGGRNLRKSWSSRKHVDSNSRQLTGIGIFREPRPQVFAHTSTSAYLQASVNTWQDLLLHFSDESYKIAGYLPESIDMYSDRFDKVQKGDLRTAFNLAYRTDVHYFDWLYFPENVTRYGDRFGRAMKGVSGSLIGDLLDQYDWAQFEPGNRRRRRRRPPRSIGEAKGQTRC